MAKMLLLEAKLSETFGNCWDDDFANQMYDHVLGTFRRNGNGEWSHSVSEDKRLEKFLFPQKDGGNIMLEIDRRNDRFGEFLLYASLTEKGKEIFFDAWKDRKFGSLDPSAPEPKDSSWQNDVYRSETVDWKSDRSMEFNAIFDLSDDESTVRTFSYMDEIRSAEFRFYPQVSVETVKDEKYGYDRFKSCMLGLYKGQEVLLMGGTEWRMRLDDGDEYPDEFGKRPVLYRRDGDRYVADKELGKKLEAEVERVYKYNGHSEDALGNFPPSRLMFFSETSVRYDDMPNAWWHRNLVLKPVKGLDALREGFDGWRRELSADKGMPVKGNGKDAFDRLTVKQRTLVRAIRKWVRANDVRNDKGYPLSFNNASENPQAALNAFVVQAKAKGFAVRQQVKDNQR